MGPIRIDPDQLRSIAQSCQASSENMTSEASNMRSQIARLHEALQGVPHLAMVDHFDQLNRLLANLSSELDQSNAYLRDIVAKLDNFVASLGG
jgi:WXG100 family type VII secretion target